jgi:16S rRNA (uracil1498-N3)-methyltransferase
MEAEMALPRDAVRAMHLWNTRPGEILTVVDAAGNRYRARVTGNAQVVPFARLAFRRSVFLLTVYQALPEKERFELVLEKLAELGVDRVVPFVSRRSTTLARRDGKQKKSHRWPHILLRAAKQCRRATIPQLAPVLSWQDVLAEARGWDRTWMLYEGATAELLRNGLRQGAVRHAALMIGPEGGFSAAEVEQARSAGIMPVSLGTRILRTETAAIVGTALVQYGLGDLG